MRRYLPMLAVAGLLLCGALIAGCATTTNSGTTAPTLATPSPGISNQTTVTPSISIVSPQDGSTVSAGSVTVTSTVRDFNVVDRQGQATVPGEGHVHFYMDVRPLPTDPIDPAIPADPNAAWAHVSGTTYTFTNVTPGQHSFAVQLVNNDHTPVTPLATDSVTVTVNGPPTTTAPTTTEATTSTSIVTTTTRSSGGY